jgi:expansin (peptidoglycan-binding protein)
MRPIHGIHFVALSFIAVCFAGCESGDSGSKSGPVDNVAGAPAESCGDVRLTSYAANKGGWCEFDRTAAVLPASVRAGLTLAIAEPWNGSSYGGDPGESCGECWEITSLDSSQIVMVHDLCPVEGNPVCNGSHFHFDVSTEAAEALNLKGLDAASTRRVPCPVTGNTHLQIIDRNEWGYVRFQVVNHRIPIRGIEFRSASDATYYPAERSGGAWAVADHGESFAKDAAGGRFRLTSAQGEVLEMPNVLDYGVAKGDLFDLGAQFTDLASSKGGTCEFFPPADVYVNGYGGIEKVGWMMNPWADADPEETTSGCYDAKCLRITGMGSGDGFHVYYRQSFDPKIFRRLHLAARTDGGSGSVGVTLTGDGTSCTTTEIALTTKWQEHDLDLSTVCADADAINSVTVYGNDELTLLLDDLRFERE